ncbi:MAG TPA: ATP-binding protein [Clostridiales bacterium]|nr:ATP-binding protein [Clostridiales bacterium]
MSIRERAEQIFQERKNLEAYKNELSRREIKEDKSIADAFGKYKSATFELSLAKARNEETKDLEKKVADAKKQLDKILKEKGYTFADLEYKDISEDDLLNEIYNELIDQEIAKGITTISDFSKVKLNKALKEYENEYLNLYGNLAKFFEEYPNNEKPNIIISGSVGSGKTYAVTVLKNALLKHKRAEVKFLVAQELSDIFWDIHINHINRDDLPFLTLLEPDVLIIDDLGTEPMYNNITIPYLYYLITTRHNQNKPTIITTNLSAEGIKEIYGERILTRLLFPEKTISIKLDTKDQRFL